MDKQFFEKSRGRHVKEKETTWKLSENFPLTNLKIHRNTFSMCCNCAYKLLLIIFGEQKNKNKKLGEISWNSVAMLLVWLAPQWRNFLSIEHRERCQKSLILKAFSIFVSLFLDGAFFISYSWKEREREMRKLLRFTMRSFVSRWMDGVAI